MIHLEIQMEPSLGELFAAVIAKMLDRLKDSLPRPIQEPSDPELASFWSEDLRAQLREDGAQLRELLQHPHFGQNVIELTDDKAEAICRSASAVRLALREIELGEVPDEALEAGMVEPDQLSAAVRPAYFCYWFLGGLQEMVIQALDPEDAEEEEDNDDAPENAPEEG
ncbi:MAG: hypothetical protein ACLFU2_05475 [Opitutales bacterium]